ncbi:hypothetical protein VUR80DRAFT_7338 [Thermomyces stellatus]
MVMLPYDTSPDAVLPQPAASTSKDTISASAGVLDTTDSGALEKTLAVPHPGHPVVALGHREPCAGSREKICKFRDDFELSSLGFPPQYANGAADCVEYWAEAKVLGSAVVFNRAESQYECNDVFLHGRLVNGGRTIYAPTTPQINELIGVPRGPRRTDHHVQKSVPYQR